MRLTPSATVGAAHATPHVSYQPRARAGRRSSGWLGTAAIIVLALFFAFILGAGTAYAGVWMGFLGVGLFSAVLSFALPLRWLLLIDLVMATVVAGSVEYFLGMGQSHWIPYLLGPLLAIRALMERPRTGDSEAGAQPGAGGWSWFKLPAIVYGIVVVGTTVINLSPGFQVVTGVKNFLFMWGVLFALLVLPRWRQTARLIWWSIVAICCLQLPVAAYQRLFVAGKAHTVAPWDSVVGTFGGIPFVGGHSASMTLFICVGLVWLLIAWRDGKLPIWQVLAYVAVTMAAVLMAEVKAVVIWLALGVGLVFLRMAKSRPLAFLGGTVLNATLVVALGAAYVTLYYSSGKAKSLEEIYNKQVVYVFDTQKFNPATREMGRVASLVFWGKEQTLSKPASLLIGNGIGASRGLSTFGAGEVARRYTFFIDTSALAVLLWDVGLLGALAFVGVLLLGGLQGIRLGADPTLPPDLRRIAEASGITLLLILSGLPYTRDAVDDSSIQFLLFFCLAGVARVAGAARSDDAGADGAKT